MLKRLKRRLKRWRFKVSLKASFRFVFDFACGFTIGLILLQVLSASLPETVAGTLVAACYLAVLHRLRRRKSPYLDRITSIAAVFLLFVVGYLIVAFHNPLQHSKAFTPTIWLPDPHAKSADTLSRFGSVQASWDILYGRGLVLQPVPTVNYSYAPTMVYEAHASIGLLPKLCPNVAHIESVDSQGCHKIGVVGGKPVYAVNRSLPRGDYEVYAQLGDTFVFMMNGPEDSPKTIAYLNTFRKVPANQVAGELAANAKAAKAEDAYLTNLQATVRQRLPFTPVLPTAAALPPNWFSFDDTRIGGSLKQPNLVETSYGDGKGDIVVVMDVAASSFHLQSGSCYRVPHEAKPVNCLPYSTQGYYYANGPKMQYLFRQVGDAMTITQILLADDAFTIPGKETVVLKVGQNIVDSLHPVSRSDLRHVTFVDGYGTY